jgi:hypothetical protein
LSDGSRRAGKRTIKESTVGLFGKGVKIKKFLLVTFFVKKVTLNGSPLDEKFR